MGDVQIIGLPKKCYNCADKEQFCDIILQKCAQRASADETNKDSAHHAESGTALIILQKR